MTKSTKNNSCVYLHTRSDDVVFYVGIGHHKRPYEEYNRNIHWKRTTEKYGYTVTILHQNLTWEQACALEIELIKKYRAISGDKLCNATAGGEGNKGWVPTEDTIKKFRESHKGKTFSPETRARMSESQKGRTHTEYSKNLVRLANIGKPRSELTKAKISAKNTGKVRTAEFKAKVSDTHKGKVLSPESIAKRTATRLANKKLKELQVGEFDPRHMQCPPENYRR